MNQPKKRAKIRTLSSAASLPVQCGILAGQAFRATRTNWPRSDPLWIRMRLRWSGRCGLMIGLQRLHKEAMMITKRTYHVFLSKFHIEIRV
jgi:hypothetical protein